MEPSGYSDTFPNSQGCIALKAVHTGTCILFNLTLGLFFVNFLILLNCDPGSRSTTRAAPTATPASGSEVLTETATGSTTCPCWTTCAGWTARASPCPDRPLRWRTSSSSSSRRSPLGGRVQRSRLTRGCSSGSGKFNSPVSHLNLHFSVVICRNC